MTTLPHEPPRLVQGGQRWTARLLVPEMWASLTIIVMWLAVLFDAIFGPDLVSTGAAGVGSSTIIPSSVLLAPFAFFGTWIVARYGFGRRRQD